jgi:hypothetical protein
MPVLLDVGICLADFVPISVRHETLVLVVLSLPTAAPRAVARRILAVRRVLQCILVLKICEVLIYHFLVWSVQVYIVLPIHQSVGVGYPESWDAREYWWLALQYTLVSEVSCVDSPPLTLMIRAACRHLGRVAIAWRRIETSLPSIPQYPCSFCASCRSLYGCIADEKDPSDFGI